MSREETIHKNMDRYIDAMKVSRGEQPRVIHIFEEDHETLVKAENKRRKKSHVGQEEIKIISHYRGIPLKPCKKE